MKNTENKLLRSSTTPSSLKGGNSICHPERSRGISLYQVLGSDVEKNNRESISSFGCFSFKSAIKRDTSTPLSLRSVGQKFGFTLVELLVAISILATISIMGYVYTHSYQMKSYNSERMASIGYIKTSLQDYYQMEKTLPSPNSNSIYYNDKGIYLHSGTGSYGVSGYVSSNFLPARYLNFSALDPETKQFYGYGKKSDNSTFDVATVLYEDAGTYKTYLEGTYDGKKLVSLVRSYSSSDFVFDGSTDNLPYNPYERKITANIISSSGVVSINPVKSSTGELDMGDIITVATGATAVLHISDGSDLSLGTASGQTVLVLSTLSYNDSNNLASKVALLLKSGEVWAEAPHLRTETGSESEFSIQTDTALAAVRGTIFGVSKNPPTNVTNLMLASGKLEIKSIDPISGIQSTFNNIAFTWDDTGAFTNEYIQGSEMKSYMIVREGEKPIQLTASGYHGYFSSTGTIDPSVIEQKLPGTPFSLGSRPTMTKESFIGRILSVSFENPGADSYRLSFGTGEVDMNSRTFDNNPSQTGTLDVNSPSLTVTGSFQVDTAPGDTFPKNIALRLCYRGECSIPAVRGVPGGDFSFNESDESFDAMNPTIGQIGCLDGQSKFAGFGCQDEDLVAYAPYDTAGDIILYTRDGKTVPFATSSIVGSGSTTATELSEAKDQILAMTAVVSSGSEGTSTSNYKNQCIPFLKSNMTFSGSYCNTTTTNTTKPTPLDLLSGSGFYFNTPTSFFDVKLPLSGTETKGIFIDNFSGSVVAGNIGEGQDYLKYDLTSLNLGNNFSIEMSVRGAALKRTGMTYLLFHTNTNVMAKINPSGDLYFGLNSVGATIGSGSLGVLGSNAFYTVRFMGDSSGYHISIPDTSIPSASTGATNVQMGTGLSIGSNSYNWNQWNDIIDSVKILKQ